MGFLSDVLSAPGDILGSLTGKTGAEAAGRSGELQAGAMTEAARISAASQEKGLAALMEQLGITRESFAPFLEAGTGALPAFEKGTTAVGLDEMLSQIMGGDLFGDLLGERTRAVEGQLGAGGLTRSGTAITEAANIPTDLAMQIENMLFGRTQNLAGMGLNAAAQSGGEGGNLSTQIANMMQNIGTTQGQGITGAAGARASGILGGAQSQQQGVQNMMNLGLLAAAAFSDPRLKQNIKVIGKAGPLDIVTWDWIDEVEDSIVSKFDTVGFLSTQVREHFPEFVGEFGGYDVINYPALHKELRCQ
ncbi:hypothetical protein MNBD_GAMMA01-1328 [hydrothermal vent metagenome]|uniref:Peptidase S74 domain-containing protein n=1 Tax=hydrothermal vent metagenome TaxID=652676 RepID=A0A3B0VE75_9ZZZZ